MEIYTLNSYFVAQSGYYNKLYRVTSRDLTDGRTDTGGWGSENEKTGNYIQATYIRPVYVTSFTVAGGFVPSWGSDIRRGYGKLDLEYSFDGRIWLKVVRHIFLTKNTYSLKRKQRVLFPGSICILIEWIVLLA